MEEKNKEVTLENEELTKVNGGFEVGHFDKCHYNPSRWDEPINFYGGKGECGGCVYNPHREWMESTCDYPNRYNGED